MQSTTGIHHVPLTPRRELTAIPSILSLSYPQAFTFPYFPSSFQSQISGEQVLPRLAAFVKQFEPWRNFVRAYNPAFYSGWTVNTINRIKAADFIKAYADERVGQVCCILCDACQ